MEETRFVLWLLGLFSLLALALAASGLFGQMSFAVSERTHEIGVRVVLGAGRRDVLGMVVGQGIKLAACGVVIGLCASFGLTRLVGSQLYGIKAAGPIAVAGAALALAAVTVLACFLPARRAMKVDPMVALRYE